MAKQQHWTERSSDDYLHRIGADFVRQIEAEMGAKDISQSGVAECLGISEGRVSQVLNRPGNITLRKMVEYARVVGLKLTVLTYDDGDSQNTQGPIRPEVFSECWQRAGKPGDFFDLKETGWDHTKNPALFANFLSTGYEAVATSHDRTYELMPTIFKFAGTGMIHDNEGGSIYG